jgi:hypothetical protein
VKITGEVKVDARRRASRIGILRFALELHEG